jgi:hypothetical protein
MKARWAILLILVLVGCSRPRDTVIPSDLSKWDTELAPQVKKLGEEDQKLAIGYITRARLGEAFGGKGVPFGTTLDDAISQQKAWIVEQQESERKAAVLKAEVVAARAALTKQIATAATVSLVGLERRYKNYDAGRYSDEQVIKVAVRNTSDRPIAGISGTMEFLDVFEQVVGRLNFDISEKIAPSGTYVWTGSRRYNQFLEEHKAMWNLEEGKYKTRYTPEMIVFADGTKLTVPK